MIADIRGCNRGKEAGRPRTPLAVFFSILLMVVAAASKAQVTPNAASQGRIVNVHEHLEALTEVPKLLAAMDAVGIAKTILVGSPTFTFTLNPRTGFAGYIANNEILLRAVEMHPNRFEAWPTIDPEDPHKLAKLRSYLEKGASGLKLYLGHGHKEKAPRGYVFHKMSMADPRMVPLYAFVQKQHIPVMFHVNPGPTKPGFAAEFIAVLERFPDMKVIAPHFMLSSIKDSRLREFLDTFPNLYSDISFGRDPYLKGGLIRISERPQKFRQLFTAYPDRFMFGTDVVITTSKLKTAHWLADRFRAYVDMLTKKKYEVIIGRPVRLQGLGLSPELSQRILHQNFAAFEAKKPSGSKIVRAIDWTRMGVQSASEKGGSLAGSSEEKGWNILEQEALEGAEPSIRFKAIEGLARKRDERRASGILAKVLKKEPIPEVREEALDAMEFFEPVPKVPVLDRVVADPVPAIRLRAIEIIEDEEWRGDEIQKTLIAATADSEEEIRLAALQLLVDLDYWTVLDQIAREHEDPRFRKLVAERLKER